ncbi:MAG: ATP-dependent Clp protease ATP-binding subunit [Prevotella sp.]|nr:ATP-dependent Clp protease ATP-binding subunit [Prevotella sp.]
MTSQFSPRVSEILSFSREEAVRTNSSKVEPEQLLLAMLRLEEGIITRLLRESNVDIAALRQLLSSSTDADSTERAGNIGEVTLSEHANNLLKLAIIEARMLHDEMVDEQHLLLAILHDVSQSKAKKALEERMMDYEGVKRRLSAKSAEEDDALDDFYPEPTSFNKTTTKEQKKSGTPLIDNFGTDITKAAEEGKLDPVIGREEELLRVMEILGRRKKNNPVLIGEPGVGKSAIVEGLAQRIVSRQTSPLLFGKRVVNLDLSSLVAGTKYRGQFEERINALVKELKQNPHIIIFIDEIHTIVGAGSAPGSMDAANILKPALARGEIQCIGATTLDEYRKTIEKDGALERRFQKIIVEATSTDETLQILNNLRERYEEHHHVRFTPDAIEQCVRLTERYVTDRQFPDKAIDALDEAGAHQRLVATGTPTAITEMQKMLTEVKNKKNGAVKEQNFELAAQYRDEQTSLERSIERVTEQWQRQLASQQTAVTEKEIATVVSRIAGVPVERIEESETERLLGMADRLKNRVIGQDNAIDKIVRAIQRNRVGLREPNHPIGAFMFLGPTGVGKTYLAKQLAIEMFGSADALIRVDMSEFTESFNTSRLVGAPPGYVGYDEGGQLTERVRRRPYSIVLLDEIEKAHGNVFNLLLQVLDEGRLTDGSGRHIDFRNTIIIMTSNAGSRQLSEFAHSIGFQQHTIGPNMDEADRLRARSIVEKALSRQFAPEFLNRLDDIITFDQLSLPSIRSIVEIELHGIMQRMTALGHEMTLTSAAIDFLAHEGYNIQYGARPLKRALQQYLEDLLTEKILTGSLTEGQAVRIDCDSEAKRLVVEDESE